MMNNVIIILRIILRIMQLQLTDQYTNSKLLSQGLLTRLITWRIVCCLLTTLTLLLKVVHYIVESSGW